MKIQGLFAISSMLVLLCAPLARADAIVVPNTQATVEAMRTTLVSSSIIRFAISRSRRAAGRGGRAVTAGLFVSVPEAVHRSACPLLNKGREPAPNFSSRRNTRTEGVISGIQNLKVSLGMVRQ